MSTLTDTFEEFEKQIQRFMQLTAGMSVDQRLSVIFAWMGMVRLKEMNDFLEKS